MTLPALPSQFEPLPFSVINQNDGMELSPSVETDSEENRDMNVEKESGRRTHKLSSRIATNQSCIERMQKLLLLLRHASKCPHDKSDAWGEPTSCSGNRRCSAMKKLLKHMEVCHENCQSGRSCQYPHCRRIRYALWHYRHCSKRHSCPVCGPLRKTISKEFKASSDTKIKQRSSRAFSEEERRQESSTKRRRLPADPKQEQSPTSEHIECTVSNHTTCLNNDTLSKCTELLQHLLDHRHGWVFADPVDPVLLNIPDYFDVIKQPMDLGTIKRRIRSGVYEDEGLLKFRADVLLTFDNAICYNMEGTETYDMAIELKREFLELYEGLVN